ncbi:MAG: hypothetical protein J6I50_04395 [Clostridia bacterium]|nr:hypothetical protein [Clostridia bacterium]
MTESNLLYNKRKELFACAKILRAVFLRAVVLRAVVLRAAALRAAALRAANAVEHGI